MSKKRQPPIPRAGKMAIKPMQKSISRLPVLAIDNGTVEAVKWLALVLMTLDHINKYLMHDANHALFAAGRVAMPLFAFVLSYNLARQDALQKGVFPRVLKRLVVAGIIASVPFIALGELLAGWWPLNIMWMLALSTTCIYVLAQGNKWRVALAIPLFLWGGAFVEFWWPAIVMCIAAWYYCRRPSGFALMFWVLSTAMLALVNRNSWALAAFPIIFAAPHIRLAVPRLRHVFYAYYPAHLTVLWVIARAIHHR